MRLYPPDAEPDPFIYDGTPCARVARAIVGRFVATESVTQLAYDYDMDPKEVERILRWAIVCLRTRRSLTNRSAGEGK